MLNFIDHWRQKTFLQIFTIYLRYLIGGAFVIAAFGMGKVTAKKVSLMGSLDKPIQDLEPIQQFFRVMIDSGMYWQFIGWTQIIAGALLMTQRFARLGAVIFFGLILNIFLITVAYKFTGTPIITGLMLLAVTYLLVWDLRSLQFLFVDDVKLIRVPLKVMESAYWIWLGFIMLITVVGLAIYYPDLSLQLGIPFLEGLIGFILFFTVRKRFFT
ncbi:MAG: hypothetical protein KF725_17175 [Cyclobacteriaceae bacterium]|nr:hypothetical protein [Cyclobacteriaceae bacterium]UYN87255.1 MAG: hypothetical protein KIT51_02970 [Cyclobacteriaceae bacterium]